MARGAEAFVVARRRWLWTLALAALLSSCAGGQRPPRRSFGSAHLRIVVDDQMSSSFRLTGVKVQLDGRPIYARQAEASQRARQLLVHDGVLEAGEHDLAVELDFRGSGQGVFSYLNGYRFGAKKEQRFRLDGDRPAVVRVIAHERGGPTTPLEERPAIAVKVASE